MQAQRMQFLSAAIYYSRLVLVLLVHGNRMECTSEKPPKLSELLYLAYCIARGLEATYRFDYFAAADAFFSPFGCCATLKRMCAKMHQMISATKLLENDGSNEAFSDFHTANKAEPENGATYT